MNQLLSDDDLRLALRFAGSGVEVPSDGPDQVMSAVRAHPQQPALVRRPGMALATGVVVVVVAALVALGSGAGDGGGVATSSSAPLATAAKDAGSVAPTAGLAQPGTAGAPRLTSSAGTASPQLGTLLPADSARVVKNGSITLQAEDGKVSSVLDAVQGLVVGAGGYVSSSATQESGNSPSGSVTLRVPASKYQDVLHQVRTLGPKVISDRSSGIDVTGSYADTQAQIHSLTDVRSRFLAVLTKATKIGEILSVQQHVDDVQGQLDRLEASRRVLADSSDLATLGVSVQQAAGRYGEPARGGLAQAWHEALTGFTGGIEAIVAHSGSTLVVLLFLGFLLLVARFGWRVARRAAL